MGGISAGYVLIFGWPASPALPARQKILFVTLLALAGGLALQAARGDAHRSAAMALSVIGPIWIAWPLLMRGAAESGFLVLPIILGLGLFAFAGRVAPKASDEFGMSLIIASIGLAWVAVLAPALSLAQLSLVLASTLTAIAVIGRELPAPVLLNTGLVMFLALMTTLLLYSGASVGALMLLGGALASPALARLTTGETARPYRKRTSLVMALALTILAGAIAWIDAGIESIYEGVQEDSITRHAFV